MTVMVVSPVANTTEHTWPHGERGRKGCWVAELCNDSFASGPKDAITRDAQVLLVRRSDVEPSEHLVQVYMRVNVARLTKRHGQPRFLRG